MKKMRLFYLHLLKLIKLRSVKQFKKMEKKKGFALFGRTKIVLL